MLELRFQQHERDDPDHDVEPGRKRGGDKLEERPLEPARPFFARPLVDLFRLGCAHQTNCLANSMKPCWSSPTLWSAMCVKPASANSSIFSRHLPGSSPNTIVPSRSSSRTSCAAASKSRGSASSVERSPPSALFGSRSLAILRASSSLAAKAPASFP